MKSKQQHIDTRAILFYGPKKAAITGIFVRYQIFFVLYQVKYLEKLLIVLLFTL